MLIDNIINDIEKLTEGEIGAGLGNLNQMTDDATDDTITLPENNDLVTDLTQKENIEYGAEAEKVVDYSDNPPDNFDQELLVVEDGQQPVTSDDNDDSSDDSGSRVINE